MLFDFERPESKETSIKLQNEDQSLLKGLLRIRTGLHFSDQPVFRDLIMLMFKSGRSCGTRYN